MTKDKRTKKRKDNKPKKQKKVKRQEITAQDIEKQIEGNGYVIYSSKLSKHELQKYRDGHVGMPNPIVLKKDIIIYKKEAADKVADILSDHEPKFKTCRELLKSEQYAECDLFIGLCAHELIKGIKYKPISKGKCLVYVDEPVNPSDIYKKIVGRYAKKEFEVEKPATEAIPEDIKRLSDEFANDINKFETVSSLFYLLHVGNQQEIMSIFLNINESSSDKPVNAVLKGEASLGKSNLVNSAFIFYPPTWVMKIGDATDRVLYHMRDDPEVKILYFQEMKFQDGTTQALKLQSADDGGFDVHYTAKNQDTGEFEDRVNHISVKSYIATTTKFSIDSELDTRTISYDLENNDEITKEVNLRKGAEARYALNIRDIVKESYLTKAITLYIRTLPYKAQVSLPYGIEVAKILPVNNPRIRRDIDKLFSVVKAIARFDYKNRACYPDNNNPQVIIASYTDFDKAWELFRASFQNTVARLNDSERKILEVIAELQKQESGKEGISQKEVSNKYKEMHKAAISGGTLYNRLKGLSRKGYLNKDKIAESKSGEFVYRIIGDFNAFNTLLNPLKSVENEDLTRVITDYINDAFTLLSEGDRQKIKKIYVDLEPKLKEQAIIFKNNSPSLPKNLKSVANLDDLTAVMTLLSHLKSDLKASKSVDEQPADPFAK